MRASILLLAALACGSIPSLAQAQLDRARLSLYGSAGFGGRVDANVVDAPDLDVGDRELNASLGGGLRVEAFVIGPLTLGGALEHRRVEVSPYQSTLVGRRGREGVTDFDLWAALTARPIRGPVGLDLYLGVPFGPSLLTADEYRARGLNVGVTGGVRVLFGPVGLFAEVGYRRHVFFVREDTPDYRTYWQQAIVNLGVAFRI
jgi:hypothetical protein